MIPITTIHPMDSTVRSTPYSSSLSYNYQSLPRPIAHSISTTLSMRPPSSISPHQHPQSQRAGFNINMEEDADRSPQSPQ